MALSLKEDLSNTLNLFRVNHIVANPCKFQVVFLGVREQPKRTLENNDITFSLMDQVKLLEVAIGSQLKIGNHVKAFCQIANRKVSASSRVANFLNYEKGKILYNTLVMSNIPILTIAFGTGCIMGRPQVIG